MKLIDYNELSCKFRIYTCLVTFVISNLNFFTIRNLYISFSITILCLYVFIESVISLIVANINAKQAKQIMDMIERIEIVEDMNNESK